MDNIEIRKSFIQDPGNKDYDSGVCVASIDSITNPNISLNNILYSVKSLKYGAPLMVLYEVETKQRLEVGDVVSVCLTMTDRVLKADNCCITGMPGYRDRNECYIIYPEVKLYVPELLYTKSVDSCEQTTNKVLVDYPGYRDLTISTAVTVLAQKVDTLEKKSCLSLGFSQDTQIVCINDTVMLSVDTVDYTPKKITLGKIKTHLLIDIPLVSSLEFKINGVGYMEKKCKLCTLSQTTRSGNVWVYDAGTTFEVIQED